MKKLFVLILLSSLCGASRAQSTLDTLLTLADSKISLDTAMIDSLNVYIYKHNRTYPELVKRIAQKLHDTAQEIDYKKGQATALRRIGAVAYVMGKSSELINSQFEAIKLYESINDSTGVAYCWNNIGLAYLQIKEYQKARETFFKALNSIDPDNHYFIAICYNNLGITYQNLEQYDSSLYFNNEALGIRLEFKHDNRRLQATYQNLGLLYHKHLDDYDKAIDFTKKSIAINEENLNYVDLAGGYINLGNIYTDRREYAKANASYEKAIVHADSSKDYGTISAAYRVMSDLQGTRGDVASSLSYFRKYHEASLKSIEDQQAVEVKRLENSFTVVQKEKELAILKREQVQQQIVQLYLIAGITIAVLLLIVIIIVTRGRIRRGKRKEEELKMELEQKSKELTSYALNFIQKNELIEELSDKINDIKKQSDPSTLMELNKIGRIVNDSSRIDQDWENFKIMFEEVHKGFFTAIKEQYPDIGNAELRLCALLRLNMNLKESSRILGISRDSVKTARYRLRKKLGLATEDNLVDFLITFDQKMVA